MKVLSIVGARPQFIKAAVVSAELAREGKEVLLHTGQHYDDEMSRVFFEGLGIPEPDYNLGVRETDACVQVCKMIEGVGKAIRREGPDAVLVYGDTNSTLAGAIAANKCGVPLAHVEAGLRSFNSSMPEEVNRILTDHCANLLFCPTRTAVENLEREGLEDGVKLVGDVMVDSVKKFSGAADRDALFKRFGVKEKKYFFATLHRQYNVDDPRRLKELFVFLNGAAELLPVVLPLHPRTAKRMKEFGVSGGAVKLVNSLGYAEALALQAGAATVLTDSGGMQKEANVLGVPCVTLRPETEWPETMEGGWNVLWKGEPAAEILPRRPEGKCFAWPEGASRKIASALKDFLK